jgi:hypothetical protein
MRKRIREMTAGMTSVCDDRLVRCCGTETKKKAGDMRRHVVCLSQRAEDGHMRLTLTTTSVSPILAAIFKKRDDALGRYLGGK